MVPVELPALVELPLAILFIVKIIDVLVIDKLIYRISVIFPRFSY